ncbi:MG406 family protein [Spiroplasma culicicola]
MRIISILVPIYMSITITFFVLAIVGIIDYSWLFGYFLSTAFGFTSFICLKISVEKLKDNQNYFLFLFFSILRFGIYLVPFLISVYLPDAFNLFGVLIGFLYSLVLLVVFKN